MSKTLLLDGNGLTIEDVVTVAPAQPGAQRIELTAEASRRVARARQAVEDFVWTAPIGQVSEVVQTKYGFHIIRVEDRYLSEADKYDLEMKRRAMEGETAGGQ